MSAGGVTLTGFVFGEHLDAAANRSLGFRLLEPAAVQPWSVEVEALARAFQGAPYPDYWPLTDLFCSVLLTSGERLIAVVRYGVMDSSATRRRGGLELIGVVGPAHISPAAALQIYRWLKQRRSATDDLPGLGGYHNLADVLASLPHEDQGGTARVLPVRIWQDGCLIFAASSPFLPDQRLALLDQVACDDWQWLPLCDGGFPFHAYAARGPLIAWTPDLMELAVKLEKPPALTAPTAQTRGVGRWLTAALLLLLLALATGNGWLLWTIANRLPGPAVEQVVAPAPTPKNTPPTNENPLAVREKFAVALDRVVQGGKATIEQTQSETQLLARYQVLVRQDPELRVESKQAQALVGLASILGERSAEQVARAIREEFTDKKGYDPDFIRLVSERISTRLARVK